VWREGRGSVEGREGECGGAGLLLIRPVSSNKASLVMSHLMGP
jgi:hypothetical protein